MTAPYYSRAVAARILFVTGKGGTGKSRIAEALARSAAAQGRPAILVRAPSPGLVSTIGRGPAPVREMVLDDERALGEFLTRALRFSFLARRLQDSRTFAAVAAAAPGLRDLVRLTTITRLAATTRPRTVVVVDAPATGHSVPLLTSPSTVLEFARLGPVERDARDAKAVVADARIFTPVLVTTPEELAITEMLSLRQQLLDAGTAPARVVVNGVWPSYFGERDALAIEAAGISDDASRHWRRHRRQAELIDRLEAKIGLCAKVAFTFGSGGAALAGEDIDALFDELVERAA